MSQQKPDKIVSMYQGYYIDFYSGGDKFKQATDVFYSKSEAIEALKIFFDSQTKSGMSYDFGGYIVKYEGHLAVTKDGIEQSLCEDDKF